MSRTALRGLVLLLSCAALARSETALPGQFLDALAPRPLGPGNMSGRVTAVAVVESRPATMLVAAASGGVWKTVNNGVSWAPVFDDQPVASVGDLAVAPSNPDIVWVGTGEANARNSVARGDGVYKSADGGKTWRNMGLRDSFHVARVVIHPKNPDIVYVAALGHVFGPNKERGLYRTDDGGKSWRQVLFINEETGFIDLQMDPGDPGTLYAAGFHVRRDGFAGGNPAQQFSPDAGLFKTTDGGKTWKRLTRGLPDRPYGRCGLSVCRKDPRVVYAVVATDMTDLHNMPGQPPKANDQPETGGVFRSDDRGETWAKVNDLCPRPFYFGQIRVDPNDDRRVYVGGVSLFASADGGKTFRNDAGGNAHGDDHALWIDPADSDHLVLGTDGGLYFSYDHGAHWGHLTKPADRPVLRGRPRHAQAVPGLRRIAGQRQLGRPQPRRARPTASPWPTGSASTGPTAFTAGQTPTTPTPSTARVNTATCSASTSAWAGRPRSRRSRPRGRRPTASTGTRRSSCRRTTQRRSTMAATTSSGRWTAATAGRRSAPT